MPYYQWYGVSIEGNKRNGAQAALSKDSLEKILFDLNIAPIIIKEKQLLIKKLPSLTMKAGMYHEIKILLVAGIRLPEILAIITVHYHNYPLLQEFLYHAAADTAQGLLFSECMKQSSILFSPFEQGVFAIGEETGNLIPSIDFINQYLTQKSVHGEQIRSALLMPILITSLTIMVFLSIIIFIIPQFVNFLQNSNQKIPTTIAILFYFRSVLLNPLTITIIISTVTLILIFKNKIKQSILFNQLIKILKYIFPLWSIIDNYAFLIVFFHMISLLLKASYRIDQTISFIASHIEKTNYVKTNCLNGIFKMVLHGNSLSNALKEYPHFFSSDDIFLIQAGELSGSLEMVTDTIYKKYLNAINYKMKQIEAFVQPIAIIILGLIIGLMIVSIYKPILSICLQI